MSSQFRACRSIPVSCNKLIWLEASLLINHRRPKVKGKYEDEHQRPVSNQRSNHLHSVIKHWNLKQFFPNCVGFITRKDNIWNQNSLYKVYPNSMIPKRSAYLLAFPHVMFYSRDSKMSLSIYYLKSKSHIFIVKVSLINYLCIFELCVLNLFHINHFYTIYF